MYWLSKSPKTNYISFTQNKPKKNSSQKKKKKKKKKKKQFKNLPLTDNNDCVEISQVVVESAGCWHLLVSLCIFDIATS